MAVLAVVMAAPINPTIARAAPETMLIVQVNGVRNSQGNVRVDVCPQAQFLGDGCTYGIDVRARAGRTDVVVRGLPPGRYAVQAFHDENANHRIDRGPFGIPREGVGFSNDAPIRFAPPRWDRAKFDFAGGQQRIVMTMRYLTGSSG